jgi:diguanylate cyclase (GGDEF)-like protein/PAS domain S-box-containing protein
MIEAPIPRDEALRLETLRSYEVLDTPPEEAFERIVQLVTRLFNVPMAMITLVDANRQWFKACIGVDNREDDRRLSFCAHAMLGDDVMTVLDARQDERFADNPLVTGVPHIRFYAGAPLTAPNGAKLGTLCIIDTRPRTEFDGIARANLNDLALAVTDALELRRVNARLAAAEEEVRNEQRLLTETFAALEDGVVVQDDSGQVVAANSSAARILGLTTDQLLGRSSMDPRWRAVHPDGSDFPGATHPMPMALRHGQPISNVVMGVHHPDGKLVWLSINARPLFRDGERKPYAAVGSFSDISEQQRHREHLEFRVYHDPLTGLPNRAAFMERIERARDSRFTVGFLDLNGFKGVNDRFGHDAGDELLRQAAERLSTCLRAGDSVARLGGDEFTVFLPGVQSRDQTARLETRIAEAFSNPFTLRDEVSVHIGTSFGFAFYPEETQDTDELLRLADTRMYETKALSSKTPRAPIR